MPTIRRATPRAPSQPGPRGQGESPQWPAARTTNTRTKVPMASMTTFISGLRMAAGGEHAQLGGRVLLLSKWSCRPASRASRHERPLRGDVGEDRGADGDARTKFSAPEDASEGDGGSGARPTCRRRGRRRRPRAPAPVHEEEASAVALRSRARCWQRRRNPRSAWPCPRPQRKMTPNDIVKLRSDGCVSYCVDVDAPTHESPL